MVAVLQRVQSAGVSVDGAEISKISEGLLILLGIHTADTAVEGDWLVNKVIQMRIFSDVSGKMNKSVVDIDGQILVVSQFTLLADASQGNRPSYIQAARPETAGPLYDYFCDALAIRLEKRIEKGIFGADMKVSLINDGPVTIVLDTEKIMKRKPDL